MFVNKKIIIFGASVAGINTCKIIEDSGMDVKCFVDNDANKWNRKVCNCDVLNPEYLTELNKEEYIVIIGSMYVDEIGKQLEKYGYKSGVNYFNNYEMISYMTENYFIEKKYKLESYINKYKVKKDKRSFAIVLPRGMAVGGLEIWSYRLQDSLKKSEEVAYLLDMEPYNESQEKDQYVKIDKNTNYIEYISGIIKTIIRLSPVIIIPNTSNDVLAAVRLIKKLELDIEVELIAVIHSDLTSSFKQYAFFEEFVAKFLCVSEEIHLKMNNVLPNRIHDIVSKVSPVPFKKFKKRLYNKNVLNIGYAGRLVKVDKRADDIIPFIERLESHNLNYNLHIAGDGDYFEIIKKFILENNLQSKVHLYGFIENNEVYEFWGKMDIFINFSEREGTSISMLEALANGVVPILTNVSGVSKFVDEKNGFIVEPGDINQMVDHFIHLDKNKQMIETLGMESINKVEKQCSLEEYAKFVSTLIN